MRYLFSFIVFCNSVYLPASSICQVVSRFEQLQQADTLQLDISVVGDSARTPIKGLRSEYDFINQYPIFVLDSALSATTRLQFSLNSFPKTGQILFFQVDGVNTPRVIADAKLDSFNAKHTNLTCSTSLEHAGIHYLVLLFSKNEIREGRKLAGSMELTSGSFLFRLRNTFGDNLFLPRHGWRVLGQRFGFEIEKKLIDQMKNDYLPLVIRIRVD
jgi:hypothetical protein